MGDKLNDSWKNWINNCAVWKYGHPENQGCKDASNKIVTTESAVGADGKTMIPVPQGVVDAVAYIWMFGPC